MSDPGSILDKAAGADRRALFAALQAALGQLADMGEHMRQSDRLAAYAEIERRLDLGYPYGAEYLAPQGTADRPPVHIEGNRQ